MTAACAGIASKGFLAERLRGPAPLMLGLAITLATGAGGCTKKSEPAPEPAAATAPGTGPSAAAATPGVAGAFGTGVISGTVKLKGKAPEMKPVTTPDPFCARQPIKEEDIVTGAGNGLRNVVIRVVKGATGTYQAPKTAALVDQSGCMYRPRVQVVMAGQPVQIQNSDQTLHNVHTYRGPSTMFNQAQIPGMAPITKTFADGGQLVKFKCDVHPWMTGYIAIATNPFSAVSDADGNFKIEKLPPGAYTLEAWHERIGTKTADVQVAADQGATVAFELAMP